jgi:phosphoglucosamine mutase
MSGRKLFGTDGMRGVAGEYPLDSKTIYATGLAIGHALMKNAKTHAINPGVLIGRDTRESGMAIATTLACALRSTGVRVFSAGVVTTPAVALLTKRHGYAAGAVVSASHNPWMDNGIKLFGGDGFKLPDAEELAIETEILAHAESAEVPEKIPVLLDNESLRDEYIAYLQSVVKGLKLDGLHIVADCANGAAAAIAPTLFARLGGNVELLHVKPDGRNINAECGALHPEHVAAQVVLRKAQIGLTFDGDADRCMLADSHGRVVNGDAILLLAARDLKERGLLTGDLVVATTMSNMGLEAALKRSGIKMLRAPVGDRYVLEEMLKTNAALGGEQSGHILLPHLATTGDGLLTALVVLDLIARSGKSIEELTADLKVYPQVIVNVRVREKKPIESMPGVVEKIRAAEKELADSGRVVIRYSGTEKLARVMIEAESDEAMKRHAEGIAEAIITEIGE